MRRGSHRAVMFAAANTGTGATGGTDALSPADIGAATAAQGTKADTAVQPARSISAGTGLTGGGDLSANRTIGISAGGVGVPATPDDEVLGEQ